MNIPVCTKKHQGQKNCPGCDVNLASQATYLKQIIDEYKPYDYLTEKSFKYKEFKKKHNIKYAPVNFVILRGKCNIHEPLIKEKVKAILDPNVLISQKEIIDEQWTKWIPIECGTVDMLIGDRTFENDPQVMSSPYRTTEKSVLTMMMPIKPFPIKQPDLSEWNRVPHHQEPIYTKVGKPTGAVHNSMMHRYYEKYSQQYG